jgi:hypothetical protein
MIVVVSQRGMDLREGETPVVLVRDFFRTQPMGQVVQDDLNDLHVGIVHPGKAPVIQPDMFRRNRGHGAPPRIFRRSSRL